MPCCFQMESYEPIQRGAELELPLRGTRCLLAPVRWTPSSVLSSCRQFPSRIGELALFCSWWSSFLNRETPKWRHFAWWPQPLHTECYSRPTSNSSSSDSAEEPVRVFLLLLSPSHCLGAWGLGVLCCWSEFSKGPLLPLSQASSSWHSPQSPPTAPKITWLASPMLLFYVKGDQTGRLDDFLHKEIQTNFRNGIGADI